MQVRVVAQGVGLSGFFGCTGTVGRCGGAGCTGSHGKRQGSRPALYWICVQSKLTCMPQISDQSSMQIALKSVMMWPISSHEATPIVVLENAMKIGQPQTIRSKSTWQCCCVPKASAGCQCNAVRPQPSASQSTRSAGVAVTVSTLARGLEKTGRGEAADIDTQKVASVRAAIAQGTYVVNPEAIADKLLSNAQEMLNRTPVELVCGACAFLSYRRGPDMSHFSFCRQLDLLEAQFKTLGASLGLRKSDQLQVACAKIQQLAVDLIQNGWCRSRSGQLRTPLFRAGFGRCRMV